MAFASSTAESRLQHFEIRTPGFVEHDPVAVEYHRRSTGRVRSRRKVALTVFFP